MVYLVSGLADGQPERTVSSVFASQLLHTEVLRQPLESVQYLSIRYTERLAAAGAVTSVGSRGNSYDNALAESFHGLYRAELIRKDGPWRGLDDGRVRHPRLRRLVQPPRPPRRRLHGEIGMVPPAEFEAAYYDLITPAPLVVTQ